MNRTKLALKILFSIAIVTLTNNVIALAPLAIATRVCPVLWAIEVTLKVIAPTFVTLMFVYGGVTYVYGADDPGTRKKGKKWAHLSKRGSKGKFLIWTCVLL